LRRHNVTSVELFEEEEAGNAEIVYDESESVRLPDQNQSIVASN
jgi:hypothetical protein